MINRFGYIILIVIAFFGCKKVDIDVPVDTPKFSVMATLDGSTTLNWEAGNDDFYMFTDFEKDSLEIYTLIGRLAKGNNCVSNCEESLTFKIRGNEVTPTVNDFDINQALILNSNLDFIEILGGGNFDTVDIYTIEAGLKSSTNPDFPVDSFSWIINGINSTNPIATFIDSNLTGINFMVQMSDGLGCVTSFSQTGLTNNNNCSLDIDILGNGPGSFELNSIVSGVNSPQFIWNNSPNQSDSIYTLDSIYTVNNLPLSVNDLQGNCSFDVDICLELDTTQSGIVIDLKVPKITTTVQTDVIFTPNPTNEQFSHVEIIYEDDNGISYSSLNGGNSSSTFTITNVEEFEEDDNGEKTKKLTIDYNANLYDANGNTKTINGSGLIGVAFPSN